MSAQDYIAQIATPQVVKLTPSLKRWPPGRSLVHHGSAANEPELREVGEQMQKIEFTPLDTNFSHVHFCLTCHAMLGLGACLSLEILFFF